MNWLNTKIILKENLNKIKPCLKLGYCPYGQLVEEFPLKENLDEVSCKIFGHDCPMFYHAEPFSEFTKKKNKKEEK